MSHGLLAIARRQQRDEAEVDMGEPARLEQDPVCGMMVDGSWGRGRGASPATPQAGRQFGYFR
jgi:hypothetical protein